MCNFNDKTNLDNNGVCWKIYSPCQSCSTYKNLKQKTQRKLLAGSSINCSVEKTENLILSNAQLKKVSPSSLDRHAAYQHDEFQSQSQTTEQVRDFLIYRLLSENRNFFCQESTIYDICIARKENEGASF